MVSERDGEGIGARIQRKEDERHTRGQGQFIADIKMAELREAAFEDLPAVVDAQGARRGTAPVAVHEE